MLCDDMIRTLEELSPVIYAESWDNVGLLAGRRDKEVKSVLLALDASQAVVDQAVELGVQMLITHHPLLFKPVKRINTDDFIGARLVKLIQNDISCYAMHTNFDVCGMADAAAEAMGLLHGKVLDVTFEDAGGSMGCGRYGRLPGAMTVGECAEMIKKCFSLKNVRVYGDLERKVTLAGILPGSGGGMVELALAAGVEIYITGDLKHHEAMDACEQGLSLIDAGHFGLEHIFAPFVGKLLSKEFPGLEVHMAQEENPFLVV